ncbi:MAG: GNAT family N-acetyltransferase [Anaerolineaceae bacterium]|nr:GNAT family N-acetyltransferase [Anaerolineaceae bacterium]
MIHYQTNERLTSEEYLDYLTRTDLGEQYPEEDFLERIDTLMKNYSVSATARTEDGLLLGAALGLTDFAYYLQVTDLSVARDSARQGIGMTLLTMIHEAAGGKERICMILDSAGPAIPFYEAYGLEKWASLMGREAEPWTFFKLTPEKLAALKAAEKK